MRDEALKQHGLDAPSSAEGARGALLLSGPLKQLQVVAMVTQKSKAATTGERFKPLAARCKWLPAEALPAELDGSNGLEGLQERRKKCDEETQFVAIVVVELSNGDRHCQHCTCTAAPNVEDRGAWEYVLDHGRTRTGQRPKFGYNGSLMPYRVSPDRYAASVHCPAGSRKRASAHSRRHATRRATRRATHRTARPLRYL